MKYQDTTLHTLLCTSYHPRISIAAIQGLRRCQIIARLMAERFPDFSFGYEASPVEAAPNSNHFLEIGVRSLEVKRLAQEQLEAEIDENPEGLEKWLMFVFDNGQAPDGGPQCAAYLEHDYHVVKRCMADPTLAATIAIYGDPPTTESLYERLADWQGAQAKSAEGQGRFSCLSSDDEIETFSAFYIASCRDDKSDAGTETTNETAVVQCEPGEAEFWSIYGSAVSDDGCTWLAVHDAYSVTEIVRIARQINAETGKPFFYRDETYGCIPQHGARLDFIEIAEALTEAIHDDLPDLDADDFARVDAFDAHPLAEMREAFVSFTDYAGLNTAADPYHAWEARP